MLTISSGPSFEIRLTCKSDLNFGQPPRINLSAKPRDFRSVVESVGFFALPSLPGLDDAGSIYSNVAGKLGPAGAASRSEWSFLEVRARESHFE